jgi:hypothetical protein
VNEFRHNVDSRSVTTDVAASIISLDLGPAQAVSGSLPANKT